MKPPVHVALNLARIAFLAAEYGLIASLLIAAATALGARLGNVLAGLANKGRGRSGSDPASAQLILS